MLILKDLFEMDNYVDDENDELLDEAKLSVVKRTVSTKRNALAGGTAMQLAKMKNPAMFKLYQKHNLIRKMLKARIMKQYGAMAKASARQKLK